MAKAKGVKAALKDAVNTSSFKADINSVLQNDVFETVKLTERLAIESEVYDAVNPKEYVRRGYSGGMMDQSNIVLSDTNENEFSITVDNITRPNPWPEGATTDKNLPLLIEMGGKRYSERYGNGYDWPYGPHVRHRSFTEKTVEELNSGKAVTAFTKGMKKRGYDV